MPPACPTGSLGGEKVRWNGSIERDGSEVDMAMRDRDLPDRVGMHGDSGAGGSGHIHKVRKKTCKKLKLVLDKNNRMSYAYHRNSQKLIKCQKR